MERINLEEFANGAFSVQVNRAIEQVMKNIQDPNTDAKAVRKVNVTLAFKPNEMRDFITTGVVTKTTLAPELGAVTAMMCGTNLKTGKVEAKEIGGELPGQKSIYDLGETEEQNFDPETGEIIPSNSKIVDLRAKEA